MTPLNIRNATRRLGPPAGYENIGHLSIRELGNPAEGSGYCESAWEPTPDELAMLNRGGSVILRVVGWQPPVGLYVEPHPTETENAPNER